MVSGVTVQSQLTAKWKGADLKKQRQINNQKGRSKRTDTVAKITTAL